MKLLMTTWFGCFLFDAEGKLIDKSIFDPSPEGIGEKLIMISSQKILEEERRITSIKDSIVVNQKRLRKLGSYRPDHPAFSPVFAFLKRFMPSEDILRKAAMIHADHEINESLMLPDFQIIQKIHAIDDLYHAVNVFDERVESWNVFRMKKEHQDRFNELKRLMNMEVYRLQEEIKNEMTALAPNTSYLIGPMLTARLLVHAGSLEKMAMLPASSIQLLGAEKALFRFKKEGGKPPKHGVLFQHESLLKASKKDKGRIARILALKIILAIRADVYTKRDIGKMLKDDFQEKIKNISKNT
jgi:nucleolar protein 56